ncbi:MAG: hypothetical protein HZB43_05465 [candidate division Zixibacteria bacterium]|nr:hypothetical protein [candidate division Zixibacteria bacterium]
MSRALLRTIACIAGAVLFAGTALRTGAQEAEPIAIQCTADLTLGCNRSTDTTALPIITTGGCSELVRTYEDKLTPGPSPDRYTITRTWTATDTCGSAKSCVQTIHVVPSKPRLAVLPLENLAESEDGARIFARLLQDQLDQTSNFDVVAAGDVETATLRARIRLPILMDELQSQRLRQALDVDYFVLGTVIAYHTTTDVYSGVIPTVGVTLQLRDGRTGSTFWSDTYHATGDSGEWLFGLGVEHDITKLAHALAKRA